MNVPCPKNTTRTRVKYDMAFDRYRDILQKAEVATANAFRNMVYYGAYENCIYGIFECVRNMFAGDYAFAWP